MRLIFKIIFVAVLCFFFLLIRAYEEALFYDPLLNFFKGSYKTDPLPDLDLFRLNTSLVFRFVLNTVIALLVLWVLFQSKEIIKFSVILYLILFVVLMISFNVIFITSEGPENHLSLFYVRRFLIQPVFLLILIPAFYFHKYKSE